MHAQPDRESILSETMTVKDKLSAVGGNDIFVPSTDNDDHVSGD
jgi:hypothetical protein